MSLYLILLISSVIIPFFLSFDRKVSFYRIWPFLLPALVITAIPFILADIFFTGRGIWGFNPRYNSGIIIASLPLEEWLFFILIPYSSIFIHYVLKAYFPDLMLTDRITRITTVILTAVLLIGVILNSERAYPALYFSVMIIVLLISISAGKKLLNRFYISFLIIIIPFLIINGILTGSFIAEEVVWYNPDEITGIRVFTVPVEDFTYGFSLILLNLLLMNYFRRWSHKKSESQK